MTKDVKAESFQERLKVFVTEEVSAAIKAGDEDRAFSVVTSMAEVLAQAIGLASLCDEYFADEAMDATFDILSTEIGRTTGLSWPPLFISSIRVAS